MLLHHCMVFHSWSMITALTSYHRNKVNGLFSIITTTEKDIRASNRARFAPNAHMRKTLIRRLFPVGLKWGKVVFVSEERYFHSYRFGAQTHTHSHSHCAHVSVRPLWWLYKKGKKKSTPSSNLSFNICSASQVLTLIFTFFWFFLTVDRPKSPEGCLFRSLFCFVWIYKSPSISML